MLIKCKRLRPGWVSSLLTSALNRKYLKLIVFNVYYKYLHQVHDKSVHTNVAQSSSEEHRLQLLLVNPEDGGEGEEEPAEPDLAACVLLVVLCTAVFLQHQVGLVLQNLDLQGVTQPTDIRVEENESLETGELCVVETQLGYPGDGLAELRLLGVTEANLPLGEGEDDEVGPAVLQQHHLVTARQLLERGDGLGPLDAHKQQLEVVRSARYCIVD